MIAKVSGQVVNVGSREYNNKSYPFFQLLQQSTEEGGMAEMIKVGGEGVVVGEHLRDAVVHVSMYDGRQNIRLIEKNSSTVADTKAFAKGVDKQEKVS